MTRGSRVALVLGMAAALAARDRKAEKHPQPPTLDESLQTLFHAEETERQTPLTPGSLWSPDSRYRDLAADLRARRAGDIVTIRVQERASAVSSGTVNTARTSSVQSGLSAAGGLPRAVGPIANLAKGGTNTTLKGQGGTSRDTTLTATLSALVTQVLPNGNLVIAGSKHVGVNAESQILMVRGIIRPIDLDTQNSVSSDRIAQMELQVNGRGVVADAVKRPFILYRLILGLLPF